MTQKLATLLLFALAIALLVSACGGDDDSLERIPAIVEQVEPLKKLLDARNRLRDLLTKVDRSAELEKILEGCLQEEDDMKQLASALGGADGESASEESGAADGPTEGQE